MGLRVSRISPPDNLPFLSWEAEVLHKFLDFIKRDDEGSLRLSKWKMLEFAGTESLADITRLFVAFAQAGEATVSSLHLAAALLLCNQRVSVRFKVSECLALFDWNKVGALTACDLLFLLQACIQALGQCIPAIPQKVDFQQLERLCGEAVAEESADLELLSSWACSTGEVLHVVVRLTPNDPEAAGAALAGTISREGSSALNPLQSGLASRRVSVMPLGSSGHLGALGALSGGGVPPSVLAGALLDVPMARQAAVLQVPEMEIQPPAEVGNTDGSMKEDSQMQSSLSARTLYRTKFAAFLDGERTALQAAILVAQEQRNLHQDASGPAAPGARAKALEGLWMCAAGACTPAAHTWSTAPGRPIEELLAFALADVAWLRRSCCAFAALCEAARAARGIGSAEPEAAAMRRCGAHGAAADLISQWMQRQSPALAQDSNLARSEMAKKVQLLSEEELEAVRKLHTVAVEREEEMRRVQSDVRRVEGAIAYLDALDIDAGMLPERAELRRSAAELLGNLQREHEHLAPAETALMQCRSQFFALHLARRAFAVASAQEDAVWTSLSAQVQQLQAAHSGSPFGDLAAEVLEACEPQSHRCEGALLAAQALAAGGALGFEMQQQQVERRFSAGSKEAGVQHLGLTGSSSSKEAWESNEEITLLEVLAEVMKETGGPNPAEATLEATWDSLLDKSARRLAAVSGVPERSFPKIEGDCSSAAVRSPEAFGRVRQLRFEESACKAATAVVPALVAAGMHTAVSDHIWAAHARVAAALHEAEVSCAFDHQQRAEWHVFVEATLQDCASSVGAKAPLASALSFVHRRLLDAYAERHGAAAPSAEQPGWAAAGSDSGPEGATLYPGPGKRPTTAARGGATSRTPYVQSEQAAQAVGQLFALNLATAAAARPGMEAEVAVLARCAHLCAEARLLATLAAQCLTSVEAEMRRLVDGRTAESRVAEVLQGPGAGSAASSPAAEAVRVACATTMGFCGTDVEAVLQGCVNDSELHTRAGLANELVGEMAESVSAWEEDRALNALSAPGAAPQVPQVGQWWSSAHEPNFISSFSTACPRCLDVARHVWRGFTGSSKMEAPLELLSKYAVAFRYWAFAQHQLLALRALSQGSWGQLLLFQSWATLHWLAGRAWKVELSRQQLGELWFAQELRLRRAGDFLGPLAKSDADFLRGQDLGDQAKSVRQDLEELRTAGSWATLQEYESAPRFNELKGLLAKGLRETVGSLRVGGASSVGASLAAQLADGANAETGRLPVACISRAFLDCLGTLYAVEQLRTFCEVNETASAMT